jgi:phage shock protein A
MVDKFEDPEKMLKQALSEMETSIAEATGAAARAIASEKLLAKELTEHERQIAHWQERAEAAVAAGDDGLARKALTRKQEHEKLARALRDELSATESTSRTIRRQVDAMKVKHAEAKRKLAGLAARQRAADTLAGGCSLLVRACGSTRTLSPSSSGCVRRSNWPKRRPMR